VACSRYSSSAPFIEITPDSIYGHLPLWAFPREVQALIDSALWRNSNLTNIYCQCPSRDHEMPLVWQRDGGWIHRHNRGALRRILVQRPHCPGPQGRADWRVGLARAESPRAQMPQLQDRHTAILSNPFPRTWVAFPLLRPSLQETISICHHTHLIFSGASREYR